MKAIVGTANLSICLRCFSSKSCYASCGRRVRHVVNKDLQAALVQQRSSVGQCDNNLAGLTLRSSWVFVKPTKKLQTFT